MDIRFDGRPLRFKGESAPTATPSGFRPLLLLYPTVRYTETILSLIFFLFNSSARLSFTVLFSFRHPISYLPFSPLLPAVLDSICHVSSSSLFD